jgi:hypothetical protein
VAIDACVHLSQAVEDLGGYHRVSRLTASQKVDREMADSPTASITLDIIGTDSHDTNHINSMTIDRVANIMNPLQIAPNCLFSSTRMVLLATSECVYTQTIKELWVPNMK